MKEEKQRGTKAGKPNYVLDLDQVLRILVHG
jgi:hypothetical protein